MGQGAILFLSIERVSHIIPLYYLFSSVKRSIEQTNEKDGITRTFAIQDGLDKDRWGLDRLDQYQCVMCNSTNRNGEELSGQYRYNWTGQGVLAYIIDSGIQGTHREFTTTDDNGRQRKHRIKSSYVWSKFSIGFE